MALLIGMVKCGIQFCVGLRRKDKFSAAYYGGKQSISPFIRKALYQLGKGRLKSRAVKFEIYVLLMDPCIY